MYNSVLDSHERSKDLEKELKDLTKEVQGLHKERETLEKRQTQAVKKRTELELDVKDLKERRDANFQAKVLLQYHQIIF